MDCLRGGDGRGQVVIYEIVDSEPIVEQVIDAPVGFEGSFGGALALSGDRAVVGAGSTVSGAQKGGIAALQAALLERVNQEWTFVKMLTSPGMNDEFGRSVAIDGDRIFVGAPGDADGQGAAYVFSASDSAMNRISPGPEGAGGFGTSLSASGGRAVIGSPTSVIGGAVTGSLTLIDQITQNLSDFTMSAPLVPQDAQSSDRFGSSVSIVGDRVLVGAPGDSDGRGAAYRFDVGNGGLVEVARAAPADLQPGDAFGSAVSISGNSAAIGAPGGTRGRAILFDIGLSISRDVDVPADLSGVGLSVALDAEGNAIVGAPNSNDDTGGAVFVRAVAQPVIHADGFEL